MRVVCDKVVLVGTIVLLLYTPLAFGTVEEWAIAIMEWGSVTLFLVFALGRAWPDGARPSRHLGPTGMEAPLAFFIMFCVLQTVPMPRFWLRVVSPGSAAAYAETDYRHLVEAKGTKTTLGSLQDPLVTLFPPERRPISVAPRETWSRIRLLTTLTGVFLMIAWWADSARRVLALIRAGIVIGALVSAEALLQSLTWNGKIYWIRKVPRSLAFGPFVNHDHFAGYVEMIIPLSIALVIFLIEGRQEEAIRDGQGQWGKIALHLVAAVLLILALFLSSSRAGILAAFLSGGVLFTVLWKRIPSRLVRLLMMVGLPALVVLLLLWFWGDTVEHHLRSFQTLHGEASYRLRVIIWEELIRSLPGFVWTGAGLGTFEQSFAPFTPPGSQVRWDKAHNDYLQLLWETGLVGGLFFLVGCYIFVRRYWWPAIRHRTGRMDVLRAGMAASLLSIALHSLVDFNLQIGSNGFLFATLAGLMVASHRITMAGGVHRDARRTGGPEPRALN